MVLECIFSISEVSKMFLYYFIGILCVFELLAVIVFSRHPQLSPLGLLYMPLMIVLTLIIVLGGKWLSRKDVARISSEITLALGDQKN